MFSTCGERVELDQIVASIGRILSTYAELITNKFPRGTPRRGVPLGKCVNNFAQLLICIPGSFPGPKF